MEISGRPTAVPAPAVLAAEGSAAVPEEVPAAASAAAPEAAHVGAALAEAVSAEDTDNKNKKERACALSFLFV